MHPHPALVIAPHAPDRVAEPKLEPVADVLGPHLLEGGEVEPLDQFAQFAACVAAQNVGDDAGKGAQQLVDGIVQHGGEAGPQPDPSIFATVHAARRIRP